MGSGRRGWRGIVHPISFYGLSDAIRDRIISPTVLAVLAFENGWRIPYPVDSFSFDHGALLGLEQEL